MGMLIDGQWVKDDSREKFKDGRYVRATTQFRDWVTADGTGVFPAAAGRYHLYVSHACPWAHRTVIFRALKKLEGVISLSVVDAFMGADGWWFSGERGATRDEVNGATYLREVYLKARPDYTGRASVPVLWDKVRGTIVSNESSEIIRMLNSAFDAFGDDSVDFYPAPLRAEIDALNEVIYETVNNGVYRAGFARTQAAHEEAVEALFRTLDEMEGRLATRRYLTGEQITEADWRFFTTLVRFDPVYYGHFKCNLRPIADYPNLANYLRELYQIPGVAETVHFDHIKAHYYRSHETINPTRIVPSGPEVDLARPHDRARLAA